MKYRDIDQYKHQVMEDETYHVPIYTYRANIPGFADLYPDGRLIIYAGYCWDGASGPTIDSKKTKSPSLVHDVLYQMIRMELIPPEFVKEADKTFFVMLKERGMWVKRARLWYRCVRTWFAHRSAKPGRVQEPPILEAP